MNLGFELLEADPDVWQRLLKRSKGKVNSSGLMQTGCEGEEYYEYVILRVDDCPIILDHAEYLLREEIGQDSMLKEALIGAHLQYLGSKQWKGSMDKCIDAWAWGSL